MLLRTSFCDILCYQILFALFQGKVIVFILFHQTSAHLYAKEKPQMSDSYLRLVSSSSQDTLLHIALCCLEGSTMSNLVHRWRRCARIVPHSTPCLEGSTPEDGEVSLLRRGRWRDSSPSLVTTLHIPGGRTLPYGALSGS